MKIQGQPSYEGILHCLFSTIKEEGPHDLWRISQPDKVGGRIYDVISPLQTILFTTLTLGTYQSYLRYRQDLGIPASPLLDFAFCWVTYAHAHLLMAPINSWSIALNQNKHSFGNMREALTKSVGFGEQTLTMMSRISLISCLHQAITLFLFMWCVQRKY